MLLETIRFKNFFSSGNQFIEICIQKYKKAVISGTNGNGKSTIANAVTFLFFGKTIKKVTKAQIVNSINGKGCVVEGEFEANNRRYLVRRGIKPSLFEIFEDGVLLDQSSVLDYQGFLEENILKCSYRTFLQTSIISIENYQPFMGMDKASRREFIEDLLDIKVFTTMNKLVKAKVSKATEELRLLDLSIKNIKDRIILQKSHIDQMEAKKKVGIESLDAKIIDYTNEISSVSIIFETVEEFSEAIAAERLVLKELQKKHTTIATMISDIKTQIKGSEKDIAFFEDHTDCPTCRQNLDPDHVHSIIGGQKEVNDGLRVNLDDYAIELDKYAGYDKSLTALNAKESAQNSKISVANSTVARLNRMITEVNKEKAALLEDDDIAEQKEAMSESAKKALTIRERQLEVTDDQRYNAIKLELFKDSGIKSKIVDQYIPVINKLVNEYLEKLDFFVSFNLDSEFTETIKSRYRDDFTYSSFSAGERQRIDLALLFTFRQLAKMRNSFSSNLLLCDEILDASIDAAGIDLLMNIFDAEEFRHTNIMVISHRNKEVFEETFDGLYEVFKRDGFTQLRD